MQSQVRERRQNGRLDGWMDGWMARCCAFQFFHCLFGAAARPNLFTGTGYPDLGAGLRDQGYKDGSPGSIGTSSPTANQSLYSYGVNTGPLWKITGQASQRAQGH